MAQQSVRDWLEALKKGWGEKFGPAFDDVGMEVRQPSR